MSGNGGTADSECEGEHHRDQQHTPLPGAALRLRDQRVERERKTPSVLGHRTIIGSTRVIRQPTARSYFWPEWTFIALGLPFALHAWVVLVDDRPEVARALRMPPELTMHAGVSVVCAIFFVLVWTVTGQGFFWPAWTMLGLGAVFLVHAGLAISERGRSHFVRLEESGK